MANPLSSILSKINRKRKLNILTVPRKETFTYNLAKTGHNIYVLIEDGKGWNLAIRPAPKNCHIIGTAGLSRKDLNIDVIICQDRGAHYNFLYNVARSMSCPILCAQYWLAPPGANQFVLENLADQIYNMNIFNSDFVMHSWGLSKDDDNVAVIPNMVDTDYFVGWNGSDDKPLCVARNYQNDKSRGLNVLQDICKGMHVRVVGDSVGVSSAIAFDKLLAIYQSAPVFINTSQWTACPNALLEAMSVGCPVVSVATTTIPEFIQNGVNGFISNNKEQLNEYINTLMKDKEKARQIGLEGRKTVMNNFGADKFVNSWNEILDKVSDQPCSLVIKTGVLQ